RPRERQAVPRRLGPRAGLATAAAPSAGRASAGVGRWACVRRLVGGARRRVAARRTLLTGLVHGRARLMPGGEHLDLAGGREPSAGLCAALLGLLVPPRERVDHGLAQRSEF